MFVLWTRNRYRRRYSVVTQAQPPASAQRKGSTRKSRDIELTAFFLQQRSARPEVGVVKAVTMTSGKDRLSQAEV